MLGKTVSHYHILEKLGEGGMGEVYRARDSRLNREVALKVLPELFAKDGERMARIQREAHILASLNHPNIAAIHALEESGDVRALVMELVEGPTLADRIAQGPIPLDETLPIARQIAEALEYAHEKGIIHRDLKPANVKITPEGAVKLLDFGLAKAYQKEGSAQDLSKSPTLTDEMTGPSVILGTAAYMSPEQATGRPVDKRTDIWAFGCVLYECLTGKRAFEGSTVAESIAAILKGEPDWNALPTEVPSTIRRLLHRCLTKDRQKRLQAIGDARIEIEECLSDPSGTAGAEAIGLKPIATGRRRERLYGVLALAFLMAAIVSAVSYLRLARAPAPMIISEIPPPEKTQFNFGLLGGPPVLSPDGHTLAFSAVDASGKTMLWVRSLDSTSARFLPGTEGAGLPFWSADSRALGFFANDKLKTIEASGGPTLVVADAPFAGGGSWSREGTILFVPYYEKGLYQVAASGGTPVRVLEPDKSKHFGYGWPKFLPDGKHFVYGAIALDLSGGTAYFASLDGKENRPLLTVDSSPTYASGFLLYVRDTTLMAQSFDPERGQLKGDARPVAERIRGNFDASENGVLIYEAGSSGEKRLTWFDRAGKDLGATGEAADYRDVWLSPDGRKIAFNKGDPPNIWVEELAREFRMRLTIDPGTSHNSPVWSPDGSRIVFSVTGGQARSGIYTKPSNGSGGEELLVAAETSDPLTWPTSWSRDGKFILYSRAESVSLTRADIWVLSTSGDRKPRLFVKTPAYDAQFSPSTRWVAYTSKESGRDEVYVVPFDGTKVLNALPGSVTSPGGKWQVSPNGGNSPRWRGDGKEIFYLGPDNQMMAAQIEERGGSLEVRTAQPLFRARTIVLIFSFSPYDVMPDGKRFVINTSVDKSTPLTLVVNWTARLANKP